MTAIISLATDVDIGGLADNSILQYSAATKKWVAVAGSDVVSGVVTDITASGNALITGTLGVTGASTLTGAVTISGALTANGNVALGNATSDTIAFYGATPQAQQAAAAQTTAGTTNVTTTSPWGFATSTQGNAVCALLDAIRTALVNLGAIKGAA